MKKRFTLLFLAGIIFCYTSCKKSDDDNTIRELLTQADVISVQPMYKGVKEKQEMAVTDEILVRFKPNTAKNIVPRLFSKKSNYLATPSTDQTLT